MDAHSTFLAGSCAFVAWLAVGSRPPGPTLPACAGGPADGECALPATSLGVGVLHGRLVDAATDKPAFRIDARLVALPAPCDACIQGEIQGSLDDGSGDQAEFVVSGEYAGTNFGGVGQFQLRVFKPNGGPALGTLNGTFEDPPGDDQGGRFTGEWRICP